MTLGIALVAVLLVAIVAGWLAFSRAGALRAGGRPHSLPVYHGAYALIWAAIEATFMSSAFTEEERTKVLPLIRDALVPAWQKFRFDSDDFNEHRAAGDGPEQSKRDILTTPPVADRELRWEG